MGCGQSTPGQVWAQPQNPQINGIAQQQGGAPPQPAPQMVVNKPPPAEVGQAVLERYIALENEIAAAEKGSPRVALSQKQGQLEALRAKLSHQEQLVQELEEATKKEKADVDELDVPDTKALFMEAGTLEDAMAKEMQEYLDAVNKEEIARTELGQYRDNLQNLEVEVEELQAKSDELQKLYDEQEQLLDEIFGGEYGSPEENRLEAVLEEHENMRNRVVEANFKWRQAQLMVDYAYKQLEFAVKKWAEVLQQPADDLEGRYAIAATTRNNLVAAGQNVSGAQRYLANVQFPYCAPPEVETLNKATSYIFTDMQTEERHRHAFDCYNVTCKRCGALLQWINQVVTQTISRDLDDINGKVKKASMDLRRERVDLIKQKAKTMLGKDVDVHVAEIDTDIKVVLNTNELAMTEGIEINDNSLTDEELAMLEQLNGDEELAPPPSSEEVFGQKVEEYKKEYQEDVSRLEHQLAENKTRQEAHLQAKLAARRNRRARKNLEQKEAVAVAADVGGGGN